MDELPKEPAPEVRDDKAPARDTAAGKGDEREGTNPDTQENATETTLSDVESLEAKVRSLENSLLRAKADYQNLQRRTAVERSEAIRYANAELMRSLVGVFDDFDRAMQSTEGAENLDAIVGGVRLVYENFRKALSDAGLETINALHRPFDPSIHEAVMQQATTEHEPGTVIEQVAKGYRLRDRVIRAAKVVVAKAPD